LIRRICKVTNFRVKSEKLKKKIQQLRISKWKSEKVDFFKKIKHECFCFKQEEQNLKYMRIKRSETSKKYQRCRKLQNKKKKKSMAKDKCIRIFDNIKYFSDKAIKQRSLRNKKRVDCSEAKMKYENWLRKVRFIQKKLKIKFLKERAKERIVLVKKYQSLEIKYKYEIEQRERKLTKNLIKIRKDMKKNKRR